MCIFSFKHVHVYVITCVQFWVLFVVNVYVMGTVHVGNWTRLKEMISLLTGTFKFFA